MLRRVGHLLVSALVIGGLLIACSDSSDSGTGTSSGTTSGSEAAQPGVGFGCCELGAQPSVCTLRLGRAKRSADDTCIDGYDGVNPDPTAPGWTQVNDKDGCPVWTPPANAPKICCGCPDGGGPGNDAGDASAP